MIDRPEAHVRLWRALRHVIRMHASQVRESMSAGYTVSEPEVITEVPLTMTTMQAVQDSWMGLVTPKTFFSTMRS